MKSHGSCLCNKVKFSFEPKEKHFDACHCSMCRRWSGGVLFAVVAKEGIDYEGEDNIKVYDSSEWAERGFCSNCGTNLFYRLKSNGLIVFCLGAIDNASEFEFTGQLFIDNKPANYEFSNKTKLYTEEDVIQMFSDT